MVHFYHEVSPDELFEICAGQLPDLDHLLDVFATWTRENAGRVDPKL